MMSRFVPQLARLRRLAKAFQKCARIGRARALACPREFAAVRSVLHLPRNDRFPVRSSHDDGVSVRLVEPEEPFERTLPKMPGEHSPHWIFQREQRGTYPATLVAEIKCGRFWGFYGGSVFTEDGRLIPELSKDVWGEHLHSVYLRARLPKPQRLSGRTLSLVTPEAGANYHHWTIDLLPRAGLAERAGYCVKQFDHVLIKHRDLPYQRETLARLGIPEEKLIQVADDLHIEAETLVVPSVRLDNTRVNPSDLEFVRRLYVPENVSPPPRRRRLYVNRRDASFRRIVNDAGLAPLLDRHGFEEVSMAGKSVAEQAELFSQAEAIVAPNGAALANLVYAPADCRVIELFAPRWIVPYFWMMCASRGLNYTALIGDGPRLPDGVLPNGLRDDIHLDPKKLEMALEELPPTNARAP